MCHFLKNVSMCHSALAHMSNLKPSLNKMLFPVELMGEYITANWELFIFVNYLYCSKTLSSFKKT